MEIIIQLFFLLSILIYAWSVQIVSWNSLTSFCTYITGLYLKYKPWN